MTEASDHTRPADSEATASFGYREVPREQKEPLVRQVFDSVAPRYDLMNDLMSLGVHRLWKAALINMVAPRGSQALLDVAGGTGDVAFRLLDRAPMAKVSVCDINEKMLSAGRDRAIDGGRLHGLDWVVGNAERLPFASNSFDAYTIAFGLRNVTDIDAALAEARRVLKPGGRFFCLEFSQVVLPALAKIYERYSFSVLPFLGGIIAGDRESYRYLAESIRKFPPQDALVARMDTAGLEKARYRNMTGGVVAIHSGWRL
ncbi:MAG: ubiE [Alphaproteobacteria bacterium]|jgi:demethylmenaquinone methyltransferase/2-methoxy-6-polyprenyl-1,4-benzoquinol methylase|nr:ubiE [Alphaproteobacteria bacterium]